MAYRCCDKGDFKEFEWWGPRGFQAAVTTGGRPGRRWNWCAARGPAHYLGDSKTALDENGVLDKFHALRRNNSMDFEPAMNENRVLDKFKVLRRITLMDFKAAVVEHEVLNKFKDLDKSYLQKSSTF